MKLFPFFLILFLYNTTYSQQINIETEFLKNGKLYENLGQYAQSYTDFRKGQKCIVLEYLGRNNYIVKFKKWTGYVNSEFLIVNNEMLEVERLHEEKRIQDLENKKRLQAEEIEQRKIAKEEEKIRKIKLDKEKERLYRIRMKAMEEAQKEADSIAKIEMRNTCLYTINEIDEFEKVKRIKTTDYNVGESLDIQLYRLGNNKFVFFNSLEDLGCASSYSNDKSYVKIKLENDDIITFYHSWDTDCGDFELKANLSNSDILKLSQSPIKTIRLQGTEFYSDVKIIYYKEFFIDKVNCIK